jgi:acetoin utilization deacetylase AcuC-like enzyme
VAEFDPEALVVALGVDTFAGDPISGFSLASEDFVQVGRELATLRRPVVFTLEGGYAVEAMGVNVVNVLEGFATHAAA